MVAPTEFTASRTVAVLEVVRVEPASHYRPSVSRETRRLLLAGALAVAALWLLARVRFEDRPLTPYPVPALLGQLAAPPSFDELADTLAQLQARVEPSVVVVETTSSGLGTTERRAALRWRDGAALLLLARAGDGGDLPDASVLAHDVATGLAVVRVPLLDPVVAPATWLPRRERQPRYLFATDVAAAGVTLRPVYVGALDAVMSPPWPEPVWALPAAANLAPGTLVFSSTAEFAGMVVPLGDGVAIVPADTVLAAATRVLETPSGAHSTLGVEVQSLTPAVAALTGSTQGVVVTWVLPPADAAGLLVGDVVDAVNGQAVATVQQWDARSAALSAGTRATLRVRRNGGLVAVTVTAAARPPASRALGLAMRHVPAAGVEVTRVEQATAGARAGLQRGDLITRVAGVIAPTPAQLSAAFAGLAEGQRAMLAVTRGDTHHVLVLGR